MKKGISKNPKTNRDHLTNRDPSGIQQIETQNTTRGNISHIQSNNSSVRFHDDEDGEICEMCKIVRGGSYIVQCDGCNLWFHFNRVKFDSEEVGEDDPWFCGKCTEISRKVLSEIKERSRNQSEAAKVSNERAESTRVSHQETDARTRELIELFMQWQSTQAEFAGNSSAVQQLSSLESQQNDEHQRHRSKNERHSSPSKKTVFLTTAQIHSEPWSKTSHRMTGQQRTSRPTRNPLTEPIQAEQTQRQQVNNSTSGENNPDDLIRIQPLEIAQSAKTSSYKSASSKRSSASQRARTEQRLLAELELQAKLDEERMILKENREKRFLEERFKAMDDRETVEVSSDGGSDISNESNRPEQPPTNDTATVLEWVEEQRKRKSLAAKIVSEMSIDTSRAEIERIIEKRGTERVIPTEFHSLSKPENAAMSIRGIRVREPIVLGNRKAQPIASNVRTNSTLIDQRQPISTNDELNTKMIHQNDDGRPFITINGHQFAVNEETANLLMNGLRPQNSDNQQQEHDLAVPPFFSINQQQFVNRPSGSQEQSRHTQLNPPIFSQPPIVSS